MRNPNIYIIFAAKLKYEYMEYLNRTADVMEIRGSENVIIFFDPLIFLSSETSKLFSQNNMA